LSKDIKLDIKMRNYYPDAPESLMISFRYTDPAIAQHVVSDLVAMFEQANITLREQALTELERFSDKIAEVEKELQALAPQRDLAMIRNTTAVTTDPNSIAARAQRITTLNLVDSLSDREFTLERQIDEQKRQIAEQEKLVNSSAQSNGLASSSAYGVLLAKRAEVEGQIKDLLTVADSIGGGQSRNRAA
jgi:hypothetical protein